METDEMRGVVFRPCIFSWCVSRLVSISCEKKVCALVRFSIALPRLLNVQKSFLCSVNKTRLTANEVVHHHHEAPC